MMMTKINVEMLVFLSLCTDDNDATTDNITSDTPGWHGSLDCQPTALLESKTLSVERLPISQTTTIDNPQSSFRSKNYQTGIDRKSKV